MELRKGVKFHSGKAMDADDVVYTLNHAANKENAIANFALLAWIKSAEKIDASKVRINLHNPFPPALAYLAGLGFIMQKGHYDKRAGEARRQEGLRRRARPTAPAPTRIAEVKPGDSILMEKNADYFKDGFKGEPKISKIKFRTIKDANTRAAELMTGAIDWIWDVPKDQAERIKANPARRGGERQDAARLLSAVRCARRCRGRSSSPTSACARRVAHAIDRESHHQEPGRPGLGRGAQPLPSRPVRAARAT